MAAADGSDALPVRGQIVDLLPSLRAFARTLVRDPSRADDLVQETIVKALGNLHRFQDGTNLQAWLFTILRNSFYSAVRKGRREVEDVDGQHAAGMVSEPVQHAKIAGRDFRKAMSALGSEQREALILVGPAGFSYEEAAEICGCAVGTMKSRVNRGRARLNEIMAENDATPPTGNGATPTAKVMAVDACGCGTAVRRTKT